MNTKVQNCKEGRVTGLEPANGGITTHCLNHLATPAKLS
jgi:hypothetical protein